MNDQQAYEQLEATRPVITGVLRRDFHRYPTPEMLAERSMISDDTDEIREMIRKASQYLFDNKHLVPEPVQQEEAETKAATPDPWTTITADPATLPPVGSLGVLAAIHVIGNDTDDYHEFDTTEKAYYDHDAKLWIDMMGDPIEHDYEGRSAIVYKWQPWPTPPPYPSAEGQEPTP